MGMADRENRAAEFAGWDSFSRFALQRLANLPHVKDLHTSFSLGEVKAGAALPLGHLVAR